MNQTNKKQAKKSNGVMRFLQVPTFSPMGFLAWAALIVFAYVVCQVLGLREYASILCGTSPLGDPADTFSISMGMVYVMIYFSFVLVVPILIIGSALLALFEKLLPNKQRKS